MFSVLSGDFLSGSVVKSPSLERGEAVSAMGMNKDLAYRQTLRNHSKAVRLELRQGKEVVGRRAKFLLEQRARAGAVGKEPE